MDLKICILIILLVYIGSSVGDSERQNVNFELSEQAIEKIKNSIENGTIKRDYSSLVEEFGPDVGKYIKASKNQNSEKNGKNDKKGKKDEDKSSQEPVKVKSDKKNGDKKESKETSKDAKDEKNSNFGLSEEIIGKIKKSIEAGTIKQDFKSLVEEFGPNVVKYLKLHKHQNQGEKVPQDQNKENNKENNKEKKSKNFGISEEGILEIINSVTNGTIKEDLKGLVKKYGPKVLAFLKREKLNPKDRKEKLEDKLSKDNSNEVVEIQEDKDQEKNELGKQSPGKLMTDKIAHNNVVQDFGE